MAENRRYYPGPSPNMHLDTAKELYGLLYRGWHIMASRNYFLIYTHNGDTGIGHSYPIPDRIYEEIGGDAGVAAFQAMSPDERRVFLLNLYPENAARPERELSYAERVALEVRTLPKEVRRAKPKK